MINPPVLYPYHKCYICQEPILNKFANPWIDGNYYHSHCKPIITPGAKYDQGKPRYDLIHSMNKYTYNFNCKCPNDDKFIYYTLKIWSSKMIMIENIIEECDHFKVGYHEDIADKLFNIFKGKKQTVTATHNSVKIKTVRK